MKQSTVKTMFIITLLLLSTAIAAQRNNVDLIGKTLYSMGSIKDFEISGDYVYVTTEQHALYILDISSPGILTPVRVFDIAGGSYAKAISVIGHYVLLFRDDRIDIVNVIDPHNPQLVEDITHNRDYIGHAVYGSNLLLMLENSYSHVILFNYNFANPQNPVTTGFLSLSKACNSVVVANNHAYLGESDSLITIVDLTNPSSLVLDGSIPNTIGQRIQATTGNSLITSEWHNYFIYDVSNPHLPTLSVTNAIQHDWITSIHAFSSNMAIFWIYPNGEYGVSGYTFMDISDPSNPIDIYSATTGVLSDSNTILMNANRLCFSCLTGINMLDITQLSSPTFWGGYYGGGIKLIAANSTNLFAYEGNRLYSLDTTTSQVPGIVSSISLPSTVLTLTANDQILIVGDSPLNHNNNIEYSYLVVYDISSSLNPTLLDSKSCTGFGGPVRDIVISGNRAFVCTGIGGFEIFDISNPDSLFSLSYLGAGINYKCVAVSDSYAYVCCYSSSTGNILKVFNISDISSPQLAGELVLPGSASDIDISGDYAYIVGAWEGILIVNITDPLALQIISSGVPTGVYNKISIRGNAAFITGSGIKVVNINTPNEPTTVGYCSSSLLSVDMAVQGDKAFIAAGNKCVEIYNCHAAIQLTDTDDNTISPPQPGLKCNPNPFTSTTEISYNLPKAGSVNIKVYNLKGQLINTISEVAKEPGEYQAIWKGDDSNGKTVSTGVYFLMLETGSQRYTHKVLFLK